MRFDGLLDLVVAAWNGGENVNALVFRKHPPYQETENLIGRVSRYYLTLLQNIFEPAPYPLTCPSLVSHYGRRDPQ